MSSVIRSYSWVGVNRTELNQQVSPDMLYVIGNVEPSSTSDVTIDTTGLTPEVIVGYCAELDAAMLLQSWEFVGSINVP